MRAVVSHLQTTPYVLKGGTALMLTRGLDRHSVDLDFDSERAVSVENQIREGVREAGVEFLALTLAKDTGTVQRFKLHYDNPETGDTLLKIETSFRTVPAADDIEVVDGIRTYRVAVLAEQKLNAAEARTAPRDLFDLAYIARAHGNQLSNDQVARLDALSRDMDGLAARYGDAFARDAVMQERTTIDDTVLALREAVEHQVAARGLAGVEASVGRDAETPTLHVLAGPEAADRAMLKTVGPLAARRVVAADAVVGQGEAAGPAEIGDAIAARQSVVVETTLATASTLRVIDEARAAGFRVEVHYAGRDRGAAGDASLDRLSQAIAGADRSTLYDRHWGDAPVAELSAERYGFAEDVPSWAAEAAYRAASLQHDRAETRAEASRAFARALDAAEAQGVDRETLERIRDEGLSRETGREPQSRAARDRDDGYLV